MKVVVRQVSLFVLYGLIGVVLALVAGAAIYLESREDLQIWHTAELEEEYHAAMDLSSFEDYLALEEALFEELEDKVMDTVPDHASNILNRYSRGSLSSTARWEKDWNRSVVLPADSPKAGVLMLHGMSDSPYSFRALAERLHADGIYVMAPRYPGHGTSPSSLTRSTWEDMAGMAHLAARHLSEAVDGAPIYVFGYSTGGPLAIELALAATSDSGIAEPAGLVLFSPAMGLTPLAALTPWQARLGRLLGLEKFAWNTVELEYDPFKYRSFPLNAAIQVWRLSNHVQTLIADAAASGELIRLPPILTFQSVVDSTVAVSALIESLYEKLPEGEHRIVAYDVNRSAGIKALLANDPGPVLDAILLNRSLKYEVALVTNGGDGESVGMRHHAGSSRKDCLLTGQWPIGTYSLSHIALVFPPDDPLYGGPDAEPYGGIQLGNVALRGESAALRISPGGLLRKTWNPFWEDQYAEALYFMDLAELPDCPGGRAESP
jgi:alpha-beta hydrolase superfamily lysophospholipase